MLPNGKEHNARAAARYILQEKFTSPKRIKCLHAYAGMYSPKNSESPKCQNDFYSL